MDEPAPEPGSEDWLWYKPPESTPPEYFSETAEGWYNQQYSHKPCEVIWRERVSDIWAGRPRCFNCGRWVRKH